MSKPAANPKSGSLCQFCTQRDKCLMEAGLGEKDCPIFIPNRDPKAFELNVRCRIEEARKIHADVAYLTKRCDFELSRSLMVGNGMYVSYFREMKNILYQHLRRLNQILPNVAKKTTPFLVMSITRDEDWKEGYKTVMNKLREHRMPEEESEHIKHVAWVKEAMKAIKAERKKEEKPCGQSGQSLASLPLFGDLTEGGK